MKKLILTAFLIFITGCSYHVTDLSVMSNKNVNLEKINIDKAEQVKHVTGKDNKLFILFIPIGYPNLQTALNDALRKTDGDMMIDISVYRTYWTALLFGMQGIEVQGTVVKTRGDR